MADDLTQRFPGEFTQRFPTGPTRRFEPPAASSAGLAPGTVIGERYRLDDGPLGGPTGEAEVYRCEDLHSGGIVALKLYRYYATPKIEVITRLMGLLHPNLVAFKAYGEWGGRFFEVMEFCAGGVMAEHMPFSEQALRGYLPGIVNGLDYCHRQGIVHRDIKPNNLFFRHADRREALIGDFGISSYLDPGGVRVTHTAGHLTLDYAAPELLDGHEVSPKTDYYGLGITLLHLLAGRSPFEGLSTNDVLVAHLRGRLDLPAGLSPEFRRLLRGLSLLNPEHRWGYAEVIGWLRGDAVAVAEDAPAPLLARVPPYPGYPQANTPKELATCLDRFEAARQLFNGDIRRWVFDYFDRDLAARIDGIQQRYQKQPELALIKLRHALDPQGPLSLGARRVEHLGQLLELLSQPEDAALQRELENALWQEHLEIWLEAACPAGARNAELLEKIQAMRKRLHLTKFQGIALFALRHILDPGQPLELAPGLKIAHPGELKNAFQSDPRQALKGLCDLLYGKRLDEWLRAAEFPGWREDLAFIEDTRLRYLEQPQLGTWCVRWHFQPNLPFPFAGQQAHEPEQLAALIEAGPENRAKALQMLEEGWIRAWLVGAGKLVDSRDLDFALLAVDLTWPAKLEAVLRLLDPRLPPPKLSAAPRLFDFGRLFQGDSRSQKLKIRNLAPRGYLSGEITLERYGQGVTLDNHLIEGNSAEIEVSLETLGCPPGLYENALQIKSNGGDLRIPLRFQVFAAEDPEPPWWQKVAEWL